MSESKWAKVNRLYLAKPARVGQASPRRAAATYQQVIEQAKENRKRYTESNELYTKEVGE